jgi:outer membrane protein assembly factor BamD (BamD/ComL family)
MTKLLNGDEDDPKVRAAARASGRFIGSFPDSIYSVYVKEVGVAVLKV